MGGKKTMEDSRKFEKDRRDKLNAAFEELCKVFPDHDPSVTLTKMEILKKAAEYIKHLQGQNDEIMKIGSDNALRTESDKLKKRITHLVLKTKELVDALRSAGVPIPNNNKRKRKKKAGQITSSNQNKIASVKKLNPQTRKDNGQVIRKVKCGCTKSLPEKKPLKESNLTATTAPLIGNGVTIGLEITTGTSVINSSSMIDVTSSLLGGPFMATQRIQKMPISLNSATPISINSSLPSTTTTLVNSEKDDLLKSKLITVNNSNISLLTPALQSIPLVTNSSLPSNILKEVTPLNSKNGIVTTTSSNILTQTIVNSTQLISIPENGIINSPAVASRLQSVPLIEKNILSNLGPGTLILADGRIVNVPPMVPQIVVKQQPAVIVMPPAKKKEKLIIPKRKDVTNTTFTNKAPIPAIQTFRLQSCPRIRPKKKPKSYVKKSEKTKIVNSKEIEGKEEGKKKRKLETEPQTILETEKDEENPPKDPRSNDNTNNKSSVNSKEKECNENDGTFGTENCLDNSNLSLAISLNENNCPSSFCNLTVPVSEMETNSLNSTSLSPSNSNLINSEYNTSSSTSDGSIQLPLDNSSQNTSVVAPENNDVVDDFNNSQTNCSTAEVDDQLYTNNELEAVSDSVLSNENVSNLNEVPPVSQCSTVNDSIGIDNSNSVNEVNSEKSTDNSDIISTEPSLGNVENKNLNVPLLIKENSNPTNSSSSELLTNIPPCISSSTIQDSIFAPIDENQQNILNDSNISSFSLDSVQKESTSGIEISTNESSKTNVYQRADQINTNIPKENQNQTLSQSGNFNNISTNLDETAIRNSKTEESASTSVQLKESKSIVSSNNEFTDMTNVKNMNNYKQNTSNETIMNKMSTGCLSKPQASDKHIPASVTTEDKSVYTQTSSFCQSISSITYSSPACLVTISTTQNSYPTVPEKNYTEKCTLSKTNTAQSLAFPDQLSESIPVQTQSNPKAICMTSSQLPYPRHSAYEISNTHCEKDPMLFSSTNNKSGFLSNEKNTQNNGLTLFTTNSSVNNSHADYCSTAVGTNSTMSHSQTFPLKPTNSSTSVFSGNLPKNSEIYSGFNQPLSTNVNTNFYSQNHQFVQNSFPHLSQWEKSNCNKSVYSGFSGHPTTAEQASKEKSVYQKNKNGSLDKEGAHSQLSYLSFQNEHITGTHGNTFFHNLSNCSTMFPGNSGSSETPAIYTSSSTFSSNSLSSHENPSVYSRSGMGDKVTQQERLFHPNNTTDNHGSFRSNEKLNTGTVPFYSNSVCSNVNPGSTQPNVSSTYSSFTQTNGPNIYTSSQHNESSAYDNSVQQNPGNVHTTSSQINLQHAYTSISQAPMASSSQPNILSIYSRSVQPSAINTYTSMPQSVGSSVYTSLNSNMSSIYTSSLQPNTSNIYTMTTQHNVPNIYPSSTAVYTCQTQLAASNSYASITTPNLQGVYTSIPPPGMSNLYTNSTQNSALNTYSTSQTNLPNEGIRYPICEETINEPSLFRGTSVSKFNKKTLENSTCVSSGNYKQESVNTVTNSKVNECNKLSITNKNDLVTDLNSSTFNDSGRSNKENNAQTICQTSTGKSNVTEEQRCTQQLQTGYLQEKDMKSSYSTSSASDVQSGASSLDHRPSASERNMYTNAEKDVAKNSTKTNSSKNIENDSNRNSDVTKYNSYGFIPTKRQNNNSESNLSLNKTSESVDKSIQSNFKSFAGNTDKKSSEKHMPSVNQKATDNDVNSNEINYGVNSLPISYRKLLIPQNNLFTSTHPKKTESSLQTGTYTNFNSSIYETISSQYTNKTITLPTSRNTVCTTQSDQQSQPVPTSITSEHKNKSSVESVTEKQDKAIQKTSTNIGNPLKNDITTDFLKSKEMERNTFIPIIDEERQLPDFPTDLFSSLQVPPGGQHSESISPTAAFLLAFPLVSTSRNVESLQDNENQDNQTSTPTTILQIGNIDPPSTELFHPIDFQKNSSKSSDHFDINSDYLNVNDLHEKQQASGYKRCEKRKDTFSEFSKDLRPTDAKQKPRIITTTTNTYSHTYAQTLLPCADYQYCEKDTVQQWPQEYPLNNPKEQKKICDRKKDKINQKGYFHQNYHEYYGYKEKRKKQQNRISVNWMSTPENREQQTEYQAKDHEPGNNLMGPPTQAQALYSTIPLDFPTEPFPDFCNTKKSNNYSWSPSKTLLPTLDNNLMIPSTLPTLVGDLALGTSTPSESYKTFETTKLQNQTQMTKKTPEKLDESKKRNEFPKGQANLFSVSQLVDLKSKKSKTNDRNYKRQDKNSKSRNNFNCTKRKDDHCMYYEDRNTFVPNANQCSEKRLAYKGGSYSAESLISAVTHNDIEFTPGFNYQQNTNYFQSEFPHNIDCTNQQYGYLQQTHFAGFNHEECQEFGFNTNQRGSDGNRQKPINRKEENFQGTSLIQPHIYPPYTKGINYSLPSALLSTNTTTTLTNFNLSTIFPEMNDQRVSTSGQPPPQMNNSFTSSQNYRNHLPQ